MTDLNRDLQTCIYALLGTLPSAVIFKNQFASVTKFLNVLNSDCKRKPGWYASHPKICFRLLTVLRKYIRYVSTTLVADQNTSKELALLKQASVILQSPVIQLEVNMLWAELQAVVLSTSLFTRLGKAMMSFVNGEVIAMAAYNDFIQLIERFQDVFIGTSKAFKGLRIGDFSKRCLAKVSRQLPDRQQMIPKYELFDDDFFVTTAAFFAEYLLAIHPNPEDVTDTYKGKNPPRSPTQSLSKEILQTLSVNEVLREGEFGTVVIGSLDLSFQTCCLQQIPLKAFDVLTIIGKISLSTELSRAMGNVHDNLLRVQSFSLFNNSLYIVTADVGIALSDLLHAKEIPKGMELNKNLQDQMIFCFLSEVSKAIEFLHARGIMHGDISPKNIFISTTTNQAGDEIAKITLANFKHGLNTFEAQPLWKATYEVGLEYQAPEVFSSAQRGAASDVYSLAICIWEMSHINRYPFDHFQNKDKLASAVVDGERPEVPQVKKQRWPLQLALMSWVSEPWKRPTVSEWSAFFDKTAKRKNLDKAQMMVRLGIYINLFNSQDGFSLYSF